MKTVSERPLTTAPFPGDQWLICPSDDCDMEYTHVRSVDVLARQEDQPGDSIRVHTVSGAVETRRPERPAGDPLRGNRRHRVVLNVECEAGHAFAIVFNQHKGMTQVDLLVEE